MTNAYSFLPWLRTGIATRITSDPATADRASIPVRLRITGEAVAGGTISQDVERNVQIYGPGDVIGVDPRAISRTEPRHWVTNVEPNYLAHIEFYDEDFPWRYTPAPPDPVTKRLRPWLALIVLAGEQNGGVGTAEFTDGTAPGRPLPFITVVNPASSLPPPGELGAWAHVHVNGGLDTPVASDNMTVAMPALRQVLNVNADNACSRLVCPRRLAANTGYHAFLVPAFETGRLAGLGLDPAGSPGALHPSWGPGYPGQPAPGQLPYYHRWFFGTGSAGDFEYLVRLLVPREIVDVNIGRRDIDAHRSPGAGLPGITTPAALGGVLKLGGALRPKLPGDIHDTWDDLPALGQRYPHPFQRALAGLINLADDYVEQEPAAAHAQLAGAAGPAAFEVADEVDPVITPPLYGRWHARVSRLLTDRDGDPITPNRNWVHRLNLDPRFRVAANLGTRVVQKRQEEFMAAAWAQVGNVRAANAKIRAAQLAREVGDRLQRRHLDPPPIASIAADTPGAAPSGKALTLTAPAHSRVVERDEEALRGSDLTGLVAVGFRVAGSRVAAAPLSPAMRRITRPGSRLIRLLPFTAARPPEALVPRMDDDTSGVSAAVAKTKPAAVVSPTQLAEVLHPTPPSIAARSLGSPVNQLPSSDNFVLTLPGDPFVPSEGGTDSPEAKRFKDGLRDLYAGWDAAAVGGQVEARKQLGVAGTTTSMLTGLRSDRTVPRSLRSAVKLPKRLEPFAEQFIEAMAYPVFDMPMYRELLDSSVDLFVPNLNLVPPNTVCLLETNRAFIESYLVGLNHEMARELLWREYPTDQRGSPFRQFWDIRTALRPPGEDPATWRERLYDIKPIDTWAGSSELGRNGYRPDELVLVIRGELLKKYPTAAIYAHRARWQPDNDHPDPSQERMPVDVADEPYPARNKIRLPLYEAKVEPDIYLLGFDLGADEAKGGGPGGDPGWFFVIKERPGDPRFGLDIGPSTRVEVWNDLSWPDVDPTGKGFITLGAGTAAVPLKEFDRPQDDQEKQDQHVEDLSLPLWHGGLSAADLAYVLFQAPVLMAVHAQEMLP